MHSGHARAEAVCVLFQVQVGRKQERARRARTIRSLKSDAVGGGGGRPTNSRIPGHPMKHVSFIPPA